MPRYAVGAADGDDVRFRNGPERQTCDSIPFGTEGQREFEGSQTHYATATYVT